MHCDSSNVVRKDLDFTRMNTGTNFDAKVAHHITDGEGAKQSSLGAVKDHQEAIARGFDFTPMKSLELTAHRSVVLAQALFPGRVTDLGRGLSGADYVGHQHGRHGAGPRSGEAKVGDISRDVKKDRRLATDYPCVVAGWDIHDVARRKFMYSAIGHLEGHPPRDQDVKMVKLAEFSSDGALQIG
jgi:hypothetical protein